MEITIEIILIFALFVMAVIDGRFKKLPSVLTTSFLIVTLAVNSQNLVFGVLAGLFGLLIFELSNENFGLADIKVLTMIGLTTSSYFAFSRLIILVVIATWVYLVAYHFVYKDRDVREAPLLPVYFLVYLVSYLGGLI